MEKNFKFEKNAINYTVQYNNPGMIIVLKDNEVGGECVMQLIGEKYQNLTKEEIINRV